MCISLQKNLKVRSEIYILEVKSVSEEKSQIQSQEGKREIMVIYFAHTDSYTSRLIPMVVINNGVYHGFIKNRIGKPEMYYLYSENLRIYIKLWRDVKRNILVHAGRGYYPFTFIKGDPYIITDQYSTELSSDNNLYCFDTEIKLIGFNLYKLVHDLDADLLLPLATLLCYMSKL